MNGDGEDDSDGNLDNSEHGEGQKRRLDTAAASSAVNGSESDELEGDEPDKRKRVSQKEHPQRQIPSVPSQDASPLASSSTSGAQTSSMPASGSPSLPTSTPPTDDAAAFVWSKINGMMKISEDIRQRHKATQDDVRKAKEENRRLTEMFEEEQARKRRKLNPPDLPTFQNEKRHEKKELALMMNVSALDTTIEKFNLPAKNKRNFTNAVHAQLISLLRVRNISRRYIGDFPNAKEHLVKAFGKIANIIDFSKPKEYCYSFELDFDHPFNAEARKAFHKHFRLTVLQTNWLDKYSFDLRLLLPEIIDEVLADTLKRSKKLWDTRLIFVNPGPLAKHAKRVESRVYFVRDRRLGACIDAEDEAIAQYADQIRSLEGSGLNINSDDESDDEDSGIGDIVFKRKTTTHFLPNWRSESLTKLLWYLDLLARRKMEEKLKDNDGIGTGNVFRKRLLVLKIGEPRRIPSGLPINWYSKSFIRSLENWEVELLSPAPAQPFEDVPLAAPSTVEDAGASPEKLKELSQTLEELLGKLADASLEDLNKDSMDTS